LSELDHGKMQEVFTDASPGTSNGGSLCCCILSAVWSQYYITYAHFDHCVLATNMYTQLTALATVWKDRVCSSEVVLEDFTCKQLSQGSCHGLNTFFQSS